MRPEELHLRYYPDPVLRERALPIGSVDDRVRAWAQRMFSLMYEHGGIGLAGPQVGLKKRIFVINLTGDREQADEEKVFVNPVVSNPRGQDSLEEGCLSFPDLRVEITRPTEVTVAATGADGQKFQLEADDLLARCIQHETDHLDGILFVTRVSIVTRMTLRKQLKELQQRFKEQDTREKGRVK